MNKLERLVYDFVKANPRLKMRVRDLYQAVCDLVPVNRTQAVYGIETREGFFFGFHDKCPWSFDNERLLAHRFEIPLRMPKPEDVIEVGYFEGPGCKTFKPIGQTRAWNWHQGAMLQWVGNSSNIAFNDFDGARHIGRVVSPQGDVVTVLPVPLAAISPDGTKAVSYSFARLRGTPHGYAYANGIDPEANQLIPAQQGLSIVDIASGRAECLFSVADIARFEPEPSMAQAFHYFSHCQFSPSGRRFKFFHRWTDSDQLQWTRMLSCDLNGQNLHIFPTAGMVSHVAWRDDGHILAYARPQGQADGYYLFHDQTDEFVRVGQEVFSSDGHPSYSKNRRWILTDTYADRFRLRNLIIYDTELNKQYTLAKLYSPKKFAGISIADHLQCDFHPRWNRDSTQICFDSAHTGQRALCTLVVGDLQGQKPLTL